jgi:hypothetical protein
MKERTSTPTLRPLLEILEAEQPQVVTRRRLEEWARDAGVRWPTSVVVQRLREHGWLLDLKTRGVWEYASASRLAACGSDDPLIELRATLAGRSDAPLAAAGESAVHLLGYSYRRPRTEVVSAPPGLTVPPALRDLRIVRWDVRLPLVRRQGLPVWGSSTLLAAIASRPSFISDWSHVADWLRPATEAVLIDDLELELDGQSRSAWARTSYLLDRAGLPGAARALRRRAPRVCSPVHLGPRDQSGRYCYISRVIDSTGLWDRREREYSRYSE